MKNKSKCCNAEILYHSSTDGSKDTYSCRECGDICNIIKEEWRERFEIFLIDDFDKENKKDNETHRWLFCWNGEDPHGYPFDCACCLTKSGSSLTKGCGCICHNRINQFEQFIKQELDTQKKEFIEGKRCMHCGDIKEENLLASVCSKCFEEM